MWPDLSNVVNNATKSNHVCKQKANGQSPQRLVFVWRATSSTHSFLGGAAIDASQYSQLFCKDSHNRLISSLFLFASDRLL
jgi:hypothetical protein